MKHQRLAESFFCCLLSLAVTGAVLVGQIQNPPNPEQPPSPPGPRGQIPPPQPGPRGAVATPVPNTTFLDKALEINEAEVQLGQLAGTKAQSAQVKTYAEMLVRDHSAALQRLQKLQPDSAPSTPTLSGQHLELKTCLSGLSGASFDHAYIDAMVTGSRSLSRLRSASGV